MQEKWKATTASGEEKQTKSGSALAAKGVRRGRTAREKQNGFSSFLGFSETPQLTLTSGRRYVTRASAFA